MTNTEYLMLEELLGKLAVELDAKPLAIWVGHLADGYNIGVYENNELREQQTHGTIKQCADLLIARRAA